MVPCGTPTKVISFCGCAASEDIDVLRVPTFKGTVLSER